VHSMIGTFLHVTDFHWDFSYNGSDWSCNGDVDMHGIYGDYWCDSPWELIVSSVEAMKNATPSPDFIFWTGDNILHTRDENLSLDKNEELLKNLTDLLKGHFPNVPTYATFGNHDYYPNGQFPTHNNRLYNTTYVYWKDWINKAGDAEQEENFKTGAYYTIKDKNGMRILALNTNLYYTFDKITKNYTDPAGQFEWMENTLNQSRLNNEKVLITGHVPPGIEATDEIQWMYEHYNKRFNKIIIDYSDIIIGLHFGHEHTDNIRLYMKNGSPEVVLFLAPSVTPWRYKTPMGTGAPHNPGFRLIKYDRGDGRHLDLVQYYMDLTESNPNRKAEWKIEYAATKEWSIPDITPESIYSVLSKMDQPDSKEFKDHFRWRSVSVKHPDSQTCTRKCHSRIYCNFFHLGIDEFKSCVEKIHSLTDKSLKINFNQALFTILSLIALLFVLRGIVKY
ncbi:hypothetical protein FSP39_008293, partial [Pinctada imbricata]